jgi:hypothetical protein
MAQATIKNDDIITITGSDISTVSSEVLNGGNPFYEKTIFTISGKVPYNESTTIATVKIEAGSNRHLRNKPKLILKELAEGLGINSKTLKLKLTNTTKDSNNNTTSFTYNLNYKNINEMTPEDGVLYDVSFSATSIPTVTTGLTGLEYGEDCISKNAQNKRIVLRGTNGSTISGLTITKINELDDPIKYDATTKELISETKDIKDYSNSSIEEYSIIDSSLDNVVSSTSDHELPHAVNIIKNAKIGDDGTFTINQKFPRANTVLATTLSSGVTASNRIVIPASGFDSVSVGDQLIMNDITAGTPIVVTSLNPDEDNTREMQISGNITADSGAKVRFIRKTKYSINLLDSGFSPNFTTFADDNLIKRNFWTGWRSKIISQCLDPVLTLRVTTASRLFQINGQGLFPATVQFYDYNYPGRLNTMGGKLSKNTNITTSAVITITLASLSIKTFGIVTGKENGPALTDWVNSDPSKNGGTRFDITETTLGSAGATSITITFNLNIEKWGDQSVISTLNLDNFISIS